MNEQIRLFAEQAKIFATPMKFHLGGQDYARVRDEKFAELIVRECEQVSLKNSHRDDDMGAIIARQIKEHFGVE